VLIHWIQKPLKPMAQATTLVETKDNHNRKVVLTHFHQYNRPRPTMSTVYSSQVAHLCVVLSIAYNTPLTFAFTDTFLLQENGISWSS
jgi:hypothetical protein